MSRYNNFRGKFSRSRKNARKSSFKAGYYAGLKARQHRPRSRRTSKKRWF